MSARFEDRKAALRANLAHGKVVVSRAFENLREKELSVVTPVISRDAALQAMLSRIRIQSGVIFGEASGVEMNNGLPMHMRHNETIVS